MILEKIFKVFPIISLWELLYVAMAAWQPEFQSNQPKNFKHLSPQPGDALHEI